jgi:cytochrome c oxidase subunit 2
MAFSCLVHGIAPVGAIIRGLQRWFPRIAPVASLLVLTGCTGDLSALDPAGPSAASIANLWWTMLAGSVLLFLLVLGLFFATVFIPDFGRRITPRTWILAGGVVMPVPILIALTGYALWQGEYLLRGASSSQTEMVQLQARATMWQWQFDYPQAESDPTIGILHIPVGKTVEIAVVSDDVIHSFWVPRLGGKIDAVPGHTNIIRLRADRVGRYGGVCSEYCGTGHAAMRFEVQAHSQEDYEAVLAARGE